MAWRDDLIDAASAALDQLTGEAADIYHFVADDPLAVGVRDWLGSTGAELWNAIFGLSSEYGPPARYPFRGGQCPVEYTMRVTITNYYNGQLNDPAFIKRADRYFLGPIRRIYLDPNPATFHRAVLVDHANETGSVCWSSYTNDRITAGNIRDIVLGRVDGGSETCGDPPLFGPPRSTPPTLPGPYPLNPGGDHPSNITFGAPYLDADGNLRIPFNIQGDGWSMGGNVNPATGDWDFGPTLPVDANGNPIGDPNAIDPDGPGGGGDGDPPADCVEAIICAGDSWPITVPRLLSADSTDSESLENLPQAIVWFARQFDAVSGQYPIKIEIADTDPLTNGDQSQVIQLPNQAEAIAELFGLAYEANTNSELAVNMLFRMIPEIVAAKNSSLIAQDYVQAITNWTGFRTKAKARQVDSNFNPLRADTLGEFLKESRYEIEGIEDDDPHTLVEWIQQIKYAVAIIKASVFRSPEEADNLLGEMKGVIDNQPEDAEESWEKFVDALNRANSNLTDRNFHPRPRATPVNDVLDPTTILPDREPD